MMRHARRTIVRAAAAAAGIALLAFAAPRSAAQQPFADKYAATIQTLLDDEFDGADAGMVVGLVDRHGTRVFSAGKLGDGTARGVDGETIFELGSVTKVFTSLLLLDAVRRGEVALDDPAQKYLPAGVTVPSRGGKPIRLLNLAAQDSGLPWHPDNLADRPPAQLSLPEMRDAGNAYTPADLYAFLSAHTLATDPGAGFEYSNVGMALLGHALERRTGIDYETLVVDRICTPLAMRDTRITLTSEQKNRLARGHWADGAPAENVAFQVMASSGSLLSTANDLLGYLAASLGFRESHLVPLMRESQVIRHRGSPRFGKTAMPWFDEGIYNPPGTEILGHGGGGFGYLAFIGIETQRQRGVVVLTNQLALSPYGIGWTLLQDLPLNRANITYRVREVVGLGIVLASDGDGGKVRIAHVFPRSPAGRAALAPGLTIRKINGTSVEGKTTAECLDLMAGPEGTRITLELAAPEQGDARTVVLEKEKFLTVTE